MQILIRLSWLCRDVVASTISKSAKSVNASRELFRLSRCCVSGLTHTRYASPPSVETGTAAGEAERGGRATPSVALPMDTEEAMPLLVRVGAGARPPWPRPRREARRRVRETVVGHAPRRSERRGAARPRFRSRDIWVGVGRANPRPGERWFMGARVGCLHEPHRKPFVSGFASAPFASPTHHSIAAAAASISKQAAAEQRRRHRVQPCTASS